MTEYIDSSTEWHHTEGMIPLTIHFHFYKGPEILMNEEGLGKTYRDMSRLVVTNVIMDHESVFHDLTDFIPSWEEFDEFCAELHYILTNDCE